MYFTEIFVFYVNTNLFEDKRLQRGIFHYFLAPKAIHFPRRLSLALVHSLGVWFLVQVAEAKSSEFLLKKMLGCGFL